MNRKPFDLLDNNNFYGHRMDDCKNGCSEYCPAKQNTDLANSAIESDKAHSIAIVTKLYKEIDSLKREHLATEDKLRVLIEAKDMIIKRLEEDNKKLENELSYNDDNFSC